LVKFGSYILPNVQRWTRIKPKIYEETPLPDKDVADRQVLGGLGLIIDLEGIIRGTSKEDLGSKIEELESYSDGNSRTLDLEIGTPFTARMLDVEVEKSSPLVVRYRVRFVQTKIAVAVIKYFTLDESTLDGADPLG